ncbi:DNA alkylation repair protein [Alkalihalobacillus sp. MEB130]|uniref:DNA alkylation repair protein n=1 Tax=Alkalihalobacillus sp. MEB130 TaxID=2976704 RepID=UPI0028E07E88|nr:DNA alkylation repair protein [Alkalihalobacillus sp. MEB130]MDT8860598.1 DNA alkylation repair protein [Alkalihalobacillus sp. MEB130]
MSNPYLCPNCKTNRSRFNLIQQVATPVKMDARSGDIIEQYEDNNAGPLHMTYRGPELRVQCATCGLVEEERMFVKRAQQQQ